MTLLNIFQFFRQHSPTLIFLFCYDAYDFKLNNEQLICLICNFSSPIKSWFSRTTSFIIIIIIKYLKLILKSWSNSFFYFFSIRYIYFKMCFVLFPYTFLDYFFFLINSIIESKCGSHIFNCGSAHLLYKYGQEM